MADAGLPWSIPNAGFSIQPVNGEFAAWSKGSSVPPDGWSVLSGSWPASLSRCQGGTGPWAVDFGSAGVPSTLVSDYIVVLPNTRYLLSALYRIVSGTGAALSQGVRVDWYDDARALISSTNLDLVAGTSGSWTYLGVDTTSPIQAVYAKVVAGRFNVNGSTDLQIDAIKLDRAVYIPSGVISLDDVTDGVTYARPRGAYMSGGIINAVVRGAGTVATDFLFKKPNISDPDTLDAVPNGATYGRPKLDALTVAGYPDLDKVVDGANFRKVGTAYVDSSNRVTGVLRGTSPVAGADLFAKTLDNLGNIQDGGGFRRTADTYVDTSGRVTGVLRGTSQLTGSDLFSKALDNLDNVLDGTTYGRPKLDGLNVSGYPLLDKVVDGALFRRVGVGYVNASGQITAIRNTTTNTDIPGTSVFRRGTDTFTDVAGTIATSQFGAGVVDSNAIGAGAVVEAKLATGAVTNTKIGALAVDSAKLAAAAVTTAKIATGAVTSNELGAAAVTTAKLATGAVTTNELGALAVTTAKIASGAVTTNELGANAVTNAKLASLSVATGNIQTGAVTANEIGALAVTEAKINTGAVTNAKIGALAVDSGKLATWAVTETKIADLAVTNTKIGSGAVSFGNIADGAVYDTKILDGAITNTKIGTGAVTEVKIDTGSVTETKIGTGAVTANKIGTGAVTEVKIGTGAVTETKIGSLAVTGAKVASQAIDWSKLDDGSPIMAWDEGRGSLLAGRVTYTNGGTLQTPEVNQGYTSWGVTSGTTDFYVETDVQFRTIKDQFVSITYRTGGTTGWAASSTMRLFNMGNTAQQATATMYGDGLWHTAVFDISAWTGTSTVRFDPQDGGAAIGAGATFWVSNVAVGSVGVGPGGGHTLVSYRGSVGIDRPKPTSKLHVVTGNIDGLRVESSNSGYLEVGKTSNQRWRWANDYSVANALELLTGASGADPATSLLTVTNSGNVGIGITSPTHKLQVSGTTVGTISATVRNISNNAFAFSAVRVANDTDDTAGLVRNSSANTAYGGANSLALWQQGAYPIALVTNNTVRLTANASGAVYTPSTGSLGVGSGTWTTSTGNDILLNTNGSSGIYLRPAGSGSSNYQYSVVASTGVHSFNGGSANEIARIEANGLGVGGTGAVNARIHGVIGALGTSLSNAINVMRFQGTTSNVDYLNTFIIRRAAGTDWTTADWHMERVVDVTTMGSVRWGGDGSIALTYNRVPKIRLFNDGWVYFDGFNGGGTTTASLDNAGKLIRTTSDGTLKEDLQPLESTLENVCLMNPVSFMWKNQKSFGARRDIGLIAQDVRMLVPESVTSNPDGTLALDYVKLVPVLVGAIKELKSRLDMLEAAKA